MVISFSHDDTWKQLLAEFEVVTFRAERRADPNGTTWCNRGRGETKEFDVRIEEIGKADLSDDSLEEYVQLSGFESTDAWREAITELNGGRPDEGWLYRVVPVEIPATTLRDHLDELLPDGQP